MAKEYVGMAIWFKNAIGAPDMIVAVQRKEWRDAAKSQASKFGYSVVVQDIPYPTAQMACLAMENAAKYGRLDHMRRIKA